MEKKKSSKFKRVAFRFWIEYHQYFHGTTTRRMSKRAQSRRLLSSGFDNLGIFKRMHLAGIY